MRIDPDILYILDRPKLETLAANKLNVYSGEQGYTLLIINGSHRLINKKQESTLIENPSIYFIVHGDYCAIQAGPQAIDTLTVHFRGHTNLCIGLCPSDGKVRTKYRVKSSAPNPQPTIVARSQIRPRKTTTFPTRLNLSLGLTLWAQSMIHLIKSENVPLKLFDNKVEEAFLLIKLDYSAEVANNFFQFYHCRIGGFRERIMKILSPATDLSSLYNEGLLMGLNEVAFKRSFIEEFELSPRDWLAEQRTRMIYKELILSDKPFKAISHDFGFCSVSHFGSFCKQHLGATPSQVRSSFAPDCE